MQQNPMNPMDPMPFLAELARLKGKSFRQPRSTYQMKGSTRAFYMVEDTCLAKKSSPECAAYCHVEALIIPKMDLAPKL